MAVGGLIPMLVSSAFSGYPALLRTLKSSNATSSTTAIPLTARFGSERRLLASLVDGGVVKETLAGFYYLDEAKLTEAFARQIGLIRLIAVGVLAVAISIWILILHAGGPHRA